MATWLVATVVVWTLLRVSTLELEAKEWFQLLFSLCWGAQPGGGSFFFFFFLQAAALALLGECLLDVWP